MADITIYADPSEYYFEGFDGREYEPHPRRKCPSCHSPAPHLHPATAFEGEVGTCADEYHLIRTNQNRQQYIDRVLALRARTTPESNNGVG